MEKKDIAIGGVAVAGTGLGVTNFVKGLLMNRRLKAVEKTISTLDINAVNNMASAFNNFMKNISIETDDTPDPTNEDVNSQIVENKETSVNNTKNKKK